MTDDEPEHVVIYRDDGGTELRLTVPWGYGSGRIPPPRIDFFDNYVSRSFYYAGEDLPS